MPKPACFVCGRPAVSGQYCLPCSRRPMATDPAPSIKRKRRYVSARDKLRFRPAEWAKVSRHYLANNVFCAACEQEGRKKPAQVVHHVRPWFWYPELRWRPENWNALCRSHHNRVLGHEKRGQLVDYKNKKVHVMSDKRLKAAREREREELAARGKGRW